MTTKLLAAAAAAAPGGAAPSGSAWWVRCPCKDTVATPSIAGIRATCRKNQQNNRWKMKGEDEKNPCR
jgi:hypothetical protein